MHRNTANLLMLFAGLLWGGGFIAQATAMQDIGPLFFVGSRFILASLAILPFAIWEFRKKGRTKPLRTDNYISVFTVACFFFLAMILQQVGLLATSVTNAGVLTGLYVVLVPIIAFFFLREAQPTIVWPGAMVAFVGIWLLGGGGLERLTWGDWFMVAGAACSAIHVIALGKVVTSTARPMAVAVAQFALTGFLAICGFAVARFMDLSFEPAIAAHTLIGAAPEILYAAFVAGALAFTIMAVCQQFTSAADAAILLSSESVFAALGGALLLGERLDLLGYAGCGLMFLAIATISVASAREEQRAAL